MYMLIIYGTTQQKGLRSVPVSMHIKVEKDNGTAVCQGLMVLVIEISAEVINLFEV